MPVIKVWCLPELSEEKLREVHKKLVGAVVAVKELGLKDERSMTMLFPSDMMKYGLGEEIIIEVTGLFEKPERTNAVRQNLADNIGAAMKELFPKAVIECFVYPFKPAEGFCRIE